MILTISQIAIFINRNIYNLPRKREHRFMPGLQS